MRGAGWILLAFFTAGFHSTLQAQGTDLELPSPDGKWVVEAKWVEQPGEMGYEWGFRNVATGKIDWREKAEPLDPVPQFLPHRISAAWSPDNRYVAVNIYYGRIVFACLVFRIDKSAPVGCDYPLAKERDLILPADRARWDGNGIANAVAQSWDGDNLTLEDDMRAGLKESDGTVRTINSARTRVLRFAGAKGTVVSADDPQY